MFRRFVNGNYGFLMNANEDGGAGAGAGVEKQVGGEQNQESVTSDVVKELEAVKRAKEEILSEKKKLQAELEQIRKASNEENKKKLTEEKNFEALLKIELEAKRELETKLEAIERAQHEEKTKLVKTSMKQLFMKELGSDVHNQELVDSLVDWSKFVVDEKSAFGFNADGVKQAVNDFRSKHSYLLKQGEVKTPQNAAKSGTSKESFADRMQKVSKVFGGKP